MTRLLIFLLFVFSNLAYCEDLQEAQKSKFEKQIKLYDNLENNSKNLKDINFYNNRLFKNKEIVDLKEDENKLNLFIIYKAQSLSDIMYMVQVAWDVERSKIQNEEDKKYFYDLCSKLFELRKSHAVEFEKIALENISKINDISEEEKKEFLEKIKKWNETQNLIKRN
jgi:hypothetical protein